MTHFCTGTFLVFHQVRTWPATLEALTGNFYAQIETVKKFCCPQT